MISVVIPSYNGARFLAAAIRSVQAQGALVTEIIVVDDGSTDDTATVVESLQVAEPRLVSLSQDNKGPAAARNCGIAAASNSLLAFLDVDDTWAATMLDTHYATLMKQPESLLSLGLVQCMQLSAGEGCEAEEYRAYGSPFKLFSFPSGLYRREAFERVGLIDETKIQSEDVDWFLRLHESGLPFTWIAEVALYYHLHHTNLSGGDLRTKQSAFLKALKHSLDRRRANT